MQPSNAPRCYCAELRRLGWPLLYETPLGMFYLCGKVIGETFFWGGTGVLGLKLALFSDSLLSPESDPSERLLGSARGRGRGRAAEGRGSRGPRGHEGAELGGRRRGLLRKHPLRFPFPTVLILFPKFQIWFCFHLDLENGRLRVRSQFSWHLHIAVFFKCYFFLLIL